MRFSEPVRYLPIEWGDCAAFGEETLSAGCSNTECRLNAVNSTPLTHSLGAAERKQLASIYRYILHRGAVRRGEAKEANAERERRGVPIPPPVVGEDTRWGEDPGCDLRPVGSGCSKSV